MTPLLPGRDFKMLSESAGVNGGLPSLDQVVKNHLAAAIEVANSRIRGQGGAAELIRLNPNTF